MRTFKSDKEMLAYIRGNVVEVEHKAVKVEEVLPKEEPKEEEPEEKPKKKPAKKSTKKTKESK